MKSIQKKGQAIVRIAIVMVTIGIILFFIFPKFAEIFGAQTEKGACEWSVVVSSLTQFAGKQLIPPECKAHRFEVTAEMLDKALPKAKRRLKVINDPKEPKYAKAIRGTKFYISGDIPDDVAYEFILNGIVAKELKDCADKVWKGKLPLFDRWWNLFDCGGKPCSGLDSFLTVAAPVYGFVTIVFGQKEFQRDPVFCIVCSRIQFADGIKNKVKNINIRSLSLWMDINYPKIGRGSYSDEVLPWQTGVTGLWRPKYEYSVIEPIAAVFVYVPTHVIGKNPLTDAIGISGKDVHLLRLIPYTQKSFFSEAPEGQSCDFILD